MLHSKALSVGQFSVDNAPVAPTKRLLSIVIPALNEAENIPRVTATIPRAALENAGWDVESVVVDNGSVDGTGRIAAEHNARVVYRSVRGYGSAYKAGFAAARGDVIVTGDADCTYPFDAVPELLQHFEENELEFLSTNRLGTKDRRAMKQSHMYANHALTGVSRTLFKSPFRDSQSGMWIFRRDILDHLDLRSNGMAFSQEIKHEAFIKGFRCGEVAIEYRVRGGSVKLSAWRDGVVNTSQLFSHRVRGRALPGFVAAVEVGTTVTAMAQLNDAYDASSSLTQMKHGALGEKPVSVPETVLLLTQSADNEIKSVDPLEDCQGVGI